MAEILRTVVNGVEFTVFVCETNPFEKSSHLNTIPHHLEIILGDSELSVCLGEQKVDGLRLVTVITVVGNRAFHFKWNVCADGGATERTVGIFFLANGVCAI